MSMIKVTRTVNVADSWRKQYFDGNKWKEIFNGDTEVIYNELQKANGPDEIDKIIGNNSWTQSFCESCRQYSIESVIFDEDADESFVICRNCLTAAIELFKENS